MWISHRKEIRKLTFRALALRRSEWNQAKQVYQDKEQVPSKEEHMLLTCDQALKEYKGGRVRSQVNMLPGNGL